MLALLWKKSERNRSKLMIPSTQIHVSLWLREKYGFGLYVGDIILATAFRLGEREAKWFCQFIDRTKSDVVSCLYVFLAGITETKNQIPIFHFALIFVRLLSQLRFHFALLRRAGRMKPSALQEGGYLTGLPTRSLLRSPSRSKEGRQERTPPLHCRLAFDSGLFLEGLEWTRWRKMTSATFSWTCLKN